MAPYYRDVYTGCIGGCDPQFINMLEIQQNTRNSTSCVTYGTLWKKGKKVENFANGC